MADVAENILSTGPANGEITPELLMEAGKTLSRSTLFALRRNYLDTPVIKNKVFRIAGTEIASMPDVAFIEIKQVGKPVNERVSEYFNAIQTTLSACHDPRYALIFIISSDGMRNRIYLGVTGREQGTQPQLFANQLGQFLCSNWPGTQVRLVEDYKEIANKVHVPLSTFSHARAFTGIPSTKAEQDKPQYPQTLDRLVRGMRGKPFMYMVLAEPLPEARVSEAVEACQTLAGQVHAFTRTTVSMGSSTGTSTTLSKSKSQSDSKSSSRSTSSSDTEGKSKGVLGSTLEGASGVKKGLKLAGIGGVAALLTAAGGPFLLSGMMGMFGQLLPSTSGSKTRGESLSESDSRSFSLGTSTSDGTSSGKTMNFGQEMLNKHAEECSQLLQKTVDRFEVARALGCWNVGVYLLSDQAESILQAQAQLKALVSGEKELLRADTHPRTGRGVGWAGAGCPGWLSAPAPETNRPADGAPIRHPIGDLFEGLTTPLNTQELSLLINLPMREMPGLAVQTTAAFSLNPPILEECKRTMVLGKYWRAVKSWGT